MSDSSTNGHAGSPRTFEVRVLRQDTPEGPSYWERHRLAYEPDMNVTSVLQRIAAQAETSDGRKVAPVAYDSNCLEEVCGSCTMIINGRVRQACSALVDKLLAEQPHEQHGDDDTEEDEKRGDRHRRQLAQQGVAEDHLGTAITLTYCRK